MLSPVPIPQQEPSLVTQNPRKLAIRSKHVMLEEYNEPVEAIILIEGEHIVDTITISKETKLSDLEDLYATWDILDYGDRYIFPGIIDSNVYLHADFGTEWENVTYSTELAAAGGVTTIIDNPIMTKPFSSGPEYLESLKHRIAIIQKNSKVDFGVYGILEPNTEKYIDKMLGVGVLGLKCFLMNAFQNTINHYQPEALRSLLEVLGEKHPNLLLLMHPEVATERELYLTSPCRICPLETRLDKYHAIKSIEFGGGANKGSYVDDLAQKNNSDDEEECSTAMLDSPSKLKGKIKKNKEKMESEDLALSELATYYFKAQPTCTLDELYLESENELKGKRSTFTSYVCPADSQCLQDTKLPDVKEEEKILSPFQTSGDEEEEKDFQLRRGGERRESYLVKHKGSLDGFLAGIPEEIDKEDSRGTLRQIRSDSQGQDADKPVSIKDSYEGPGLEIGEKIDILPDIQYFEHKTSEEREKEEKVTPSKKYGRQRYFAIDDEGDNSIVQEPADLVQQDEQKRGLLLNLRPMQNANPFDSQSSLKEEKSSTFDSFDACLKSGFNSERKCAKDENNDLTSGQLLNMNRRFLTLVTESDSKKTTRKCTLAGDKSTLESENNNDESDGSKNIRLISFDINISPEQTPISMQGSPQNFELESPNMSPSRFNRGASANSSLLNRRLSRKSSCNIDGSNNSIMSSPTMNRLDVSTMSKGSSASKEAEYNQNYRMFLANRPQNWEENAVSLILAAIKPETKLRVILQNLSLASSLFKVRQKQKSSTEMMGKVIGDTCPSYLFFNEKMVKKGETKFKVSPPFRNYENRHILLENLRLGGVNMMGSYHFYVPPRFKLIDEGNFRRAFGGLDSLGCSLQATWTASLESIQNNKMFTEDLEWRKKVTNDILRYIYKAMCVNPAQVLNIAKKKGTIAKGKDADFVIWDPYSAENFNQLGPNHIFAGKELLGKVHKTYLRGNLIFDRDEPEKVIRNYTANFVKC